MDMSVKPAALPELSPAAIQERRTVTLAGIEWRESAASGSPKLIVRGHAAVFDRLSLDLGGFRERVEHAAFSAVLDRNPDVHLVWQHDMSRPLSRTRSAKYGLELREDPLGLHFYGKVAPTSYAYDLRELMEGGVIDQASFAFTVAPGGDRWEIDEAGNVTRTIVEIGELFDVTITAQGAYPQTDTAIVADVRSRIARNITIGQLPERAAQAVENVAPDDPAGESESREDAGSGEERNVAPDKPEGVEPSREDAGGEERAVMGLREYQRHTRCELELAQRRLYAALSD